jgi:hypothetical protein
MNYFSSTFSDLDEKAACNAFARLQSTMLAIVLHCSTYVIDETTRGRVMLPREQDFMSVLAARLVEAEARGMGSCP